MNGRRMSCVAAILMVSSIAAVLRGSGEEEEADQQVEEVLADRANPVVAERVAAAYSIYDEDDLEEPAVVEVKEWITRESSPWVRYWLLRMIVERYEDSEESFILRFLEDSDPTLQVLAAEYEFTEITPRGVSSPRLTMPWPGGVGHGS